MRHVKLYGSALLALLVVGGIIEHTQYTASLPKTMSAAVPARVDMVPAPIRRDWLIEGTPLTEAAEVARSGDGFTQVYVWRTTAARFHWHYDFDEVVTIVDGDVFIADESGRERHLVPGDVAFFPVGAKTTWRVSDHLRKIAVIKKPVPGVVASSLRWVRALKGMVKPSPAFAAE